MSTRTMFTPSSGRGIDAVEHFLRQHHAREIRAHQVLEAEKGETGPLPETLDPRLADALRAEGITGLYSHQAQAFESIEGGRDTLLVSSTASGKTLAFLLPILDTFCKAPSPFGILLMYPTKALSRDQEGTLGRLVKAATNTRRLGTFDGDTPRDERRRIQSGADFVITNPDMLHAGLLPNHSRGWKSFLARLRYVVVDEVHSYRGAFGSHVANVFRRLQRVCEMHGSRPVFIGCSATIGNPGEHASALFQRDFEVIKKDGAPRPRRDLYLVNPPLRASEGSALVRKGPASITIPLLRAAAAAGVRTICFCRARQQVERLYRAVTDSHPEIRDRIKPYRGGLLPSERRALERELFEGRITVVISTNALELGIDIGDLDLCVLSGYPGTMAGFWQRSGRAGRKGRRAMIVYVAQDTPIDQYVVNHPDFLLRAPIERAWLNADNPYILLQHLPCAAHEHPLRREEPHFRGDVYREAVALLREENILRPYHENLRYALPDYPARGVNLRGMTDYNIDIYHGSEIIGEIDPIGARGTLYKDAIYQHLGRRYMSMDLDLERKLCRVEQVEVDYYTEAVWDNRIEMTEVEEQRSVKNARMRFGDIHVSLQPKLYKKIRERSYENIGYGPITLDPFAYDTTGLALCPPPDWEAAMKELDPWYPHAALYGLRYILRLVAPTLCMADKNDMESDVALFEVENAEWRHALFLFDTIQGGVGYAEKVYEQIETALGLCAAIIDECDCSCGCPACVPPLPPGVNDEDFELFLVNSDAALACTRAFLTALLDGRIVKPQVHTIREPLHTAVEEPPPDTDTIQLRRRLHRASSNLKQNRERLH